MAAGKYNMVVQQGATFGLTLTIKDNSGVPLDLSTFAVRSQIRMKVTDSQPLVAFTCTVTDPAAGKAMLSLTAEQTSALKFDKALYDVEIANSDGVVDRIMQGNVVLSKEITR